MSIITNLPQYRDTSISTMLRNNPDEVFVFSTKEDSIVQTDSFENDNIHDISLLSELVQETESVTLISNSNISSDFDNLPNDQQNPDSAFFIDWGNFPDDSLSQATDTVLSDTTIIISDTVEISTDTPVVEHRIEVKREYEGNDLMTVVIIAILFIVGWIKLNFSKQLSQIIKGFFSYRQSNRLFKEQNSLQQRISGVMDILYFLITSVFISQLLNEFDYSFLRLNHSYSSVIISIIYIVLIYSKILVYKTIGYLFDNILLTAEYINSTFIVKRVQALVILPFLIAIPFVPDTLSFWLIAMGIGIYLLFYLFQILKGIQIIIIKNQSVIYSILYLCALEIVPILIILKIVNLFL